MAPIRNPFIEGLLIGATAPLGHLRNSIIQEY
jgi:hypothetical protein